MKRETEGDSLTVSTHSVSVFDEISETLSDRASARDGKLVWGASTLMDQLPGEETSETETVQKDLIARPAEKGKRNIGRSRVVVWSEHVLQAKRGERAGRCVRGMVVGLMRGGVNKMEQVQPDQAVSNSVAVMGCHKYTGTRQRKHSHVVPEPPPS